MADNGQKRDSIHLSKEDLGVLVGAGLLNMRLWLELSLVNKQILSLDDKRNIINVERALSIIQQQMYK